jgi:hypothetical protein
MVEPWHHHRAAGYLLQQIFREQGLDFDHLALAAIATTTGIAIAAALSMKSP